jgi:hemolysin activation/secretion protein
MSTRTIIEINHDYLNATTLETLLQLWHRLPSSDVATMLNAGDGKPVTWGGCGIRILAQRHHSETLKLTVE